MPRTLQQTLSETNQPLTSHGYVFDTSPHALGELVDSSGLIADVSVLRQRMAEDGYLLLRGYLDHEKVLAARSELCRKLDQVGLLDRGSSPTDAIYSGSNEGLSRVDRTAYAKDLRTGTALRAVCHQGRMMEFYESFLGGPPLALYHIWVRNVRVGAATGVHFDWVYMGRGTRDLYTTWIPMGPVPLSDGPLAILEGSHQIAELQSSYATLDVDRPDSQSGRKQEYLGGWLTKDTTDVQRRFGGRWLTTEFEPGDMLLFGMFTLHCSLDNTSPVNRIRLSTDTRYQLASEPVDERWATEEAFGHGMM